MNRVFAKISSQYLKACLVLNPAPSVFLTYEPMITLNLKISVARE